MNTNVIYRANVYLADRIVGVIHYRSGRGSFDYQDIAPEHPILGLRFEYDPSYGSRREVSIPSWFVNLLPERESGLRHLYNRQLDRTSVSDFVLLIYLGNDLPGAVRVEADGPLPNEVAEALDSARMHDGTRKPSFSLSGMQLKFSMQQVGDRYLAPGQDEYGDWIVKLPSNTYAAMPANEHCMMNWAQAAGIDIPENHLVPTEQLDGLPAGVIGPGALAYAVRRFDRSPAGRVHQEDFAQILDALPGAKDRGSQELIGRVLLDECPESDFIEYIRRLVFCVLSGNTDEHLKNWTLRYRGGRTAHLSPAYDLSAVTAYERFHNDRLTLPIAGVDDTRLIEAGDFRRFARTLGTDEELVANTVQDTVRMMRATWPEIGSGATVPAFIRQHIDDRLEYLPLANLEGSRRRHRDYGGADGDVS
jgi:serine/threonine-protein kinase HipA